MEHSRLQINTHTHKLLLPIKLFNFYLYSCINKWKISPLHLHYLNMIYLGSHFAIFQQLELFPVHITNYWDDECGNNNIKLLHQRIQLSHSYWAWHLMQALHPLDQTLTLLMTHTDLYCSSLWCTTYLDNQITHRNFQQVQQAQRLCYCT